MKFLFYAFVIFASVNGILSQYDSSDEEDDVRGYGYTSPAMILDRIERVLNSLNYFREKLLDGASERAEKFLKEFNVEKVFSEKTHDIETQLQEKLQRSSNQACNVLFEKKKAEIIEQLRDFPSAVNANIELVTVGANHLEKILKRMIERVNRYSAEAGDCRVADNAQCELLARYFKDVDDVYSANVNVLRKELGNYDPSTPEKEAKEIAQVVVDNIEKPVRECLSRSA